MLKNRKLARSISDLGFYEFRRQLEYKARQYGSRLIVADRWYASTKLCSSCLRKNEQLTLKDRVWVCKYCDSQHDRDENASKNLEFYVDHLSTASSAGSNACGEDISRIKRYLDLRRASLKQESNIRPMIRFE